MEESKLLELGFKNTSYTDEENNSFTEFTLYHEDGFKIQVSGEDYVEIFVDEIWIHWNITYGAMSRFALQKCSSYRKCYWQTCL